MSVLVLLLLLPIFQLLLLLTPIAIASTIINHTLGFVFVTDLALRSDTLPRPSQSGMPHYLGYDLLPEAALLSDLAKKAD